MNVFHQRNKKRFRRRIRSRVTPQEKLLWARIRQRQCDGFKFLRQYVVGDHVLDFYCPSEKFAIELLEPNSEDPNPNSDCETQNEAQDRVLYLSDIGVNVLRVMNSEIDNNLDFVIDLIKFEIKRSVVVIE